MNIVAPYPLIHWTEAGNACSARWRSESGNPPPRKVVIVDDQTSADAAYRLARNGTALLWRGDFQNARLLLQALTRRLDKPQPQQAGTWGAPAASPLAAFQLQRQQQARRAQTLAMLLLPLDADYSVPLRRAPDLRQACAAAYGPAEETKEAKTTNVANAENAGASLVSLRELLGLIGAFEWRKKGVPVAALDARIHPHYGVFAPIRGEYVDLVAQAPLPDTDLAFDIGTGTGVIAAVLARRGVARVLATDSDPRALACARDNLKRLGFAKQVEVIEADLFPSGRAGLIVCNPPWLPAQPSSPIEHAVYDPDGRMLRGFLNGLAAHLTPAGEGWLLLSDLAEHLGLRSRTELLAAFADAGLKVIARNDVRPRHPRVADTSDPLHRARAAEVTSLWRLAAV